MSLRDDIMKLMEDGDWWTVPRLAKILDAPSRSSIYQKLKSETLWGNVEMGELVRDESGPEMRLWRRIR